MIVLDSIVEGPGSILGTAVDISAIFKKVSYNVQPPSSTGFMQGTVSGVVSMVHITNLIFQAVQDHLLPEHAPNIREAFLFTLRLNRPPKRQQWSGANTNILGDTQPSAVR